MSLSHVWPKGNQIADKNTKTLAVFVVEILILTLTFEFVTLDSPDMAHSSIQPRNQPREYYSRVLHFLIFRYLITR